MTDEGMNDNRHLYVPMVCTKCEWRGTSGEVIVTNTLRCPKCNAEARAGAKAMSDDHVPAKAGIVERLQEAMHEESALHAPRTTKAIEAMREAKEEIERLQAHNADLRRWRALDKPLTAAMSIANSYNAPLRAEIERLTRERDHYLALTLEYQRAALEQKS
jgi:hypothetical protein